MGGRGPVPPRAVRSGQRSRPAGDPPIPTCRRGSRGRPSPPDAGELLFRSAEASEPATAFTRDEGLELVRLVPDGWRTRRRDFLIGDADRFTAIDTTDLARLRAVLDDAQAAGVRVVLTMFSLPGARWRQKNGDRDDGRLWADTTYR